MPLTVKNTLSDEKESILVKEVVYMAVRLTKALYI